MPPPLEYAPRDRPPPRDVLRRARIWIGILLVVVPAPLAVGALVFAFCCPAAPPKSALPAERAQYDLGWYGALAAAAVTTLLGSLTLTALCRRRTRPGASGRA